MTLKLTDYFIATLVVGMFIALISVAVVYFSGASGTGNALEGYDKLNETMELIADMDKSQEVSEKEGAFDLIGDFFSQGYEAFKVTRSSVGVMDEIATNAIDKAEMGEVGSTVKVYVSAIILIIVVIGIIAVLLNKEL